MVIASVDAIESLGYYSDEIIVDVLCEEVLQVEDRGIILLREPLLSYSLLLTTDIPRVPSGKYNYVRLQF